jgi:hypothetical protein
LNEIHLIRSQLGIERERTGAVAQACAGALAGADPRAFAAGSALAEFHQAGVEYLACVLAWFDERDRRLRELYARRPADDPERRSVDKMLAGGGNSLEALERLESVAGVPERWQEFSRFFAGPWQTRRDAIDRILSSGLRVADWRVIAGIDADSILEERRRYARFRQHLPAAMAATAGL